MDRAKWKICVSVWVLALVALIVLFFLPLTDLRASLKKSVGVSNVPIVIGLGEIVFMLALIDLGILILRNRPDPVEKLPDPLRECVGGYYEHRGICFGPKFKLKDGVCWLEIYIQNRYERPGTIKLVMNFQGIQAAEMDVFEEITCPGGALVVRRIPYPVPKALAGARVHYVFGASTDFPEGKGRQLRRRRGRNISLRGETKVLPYGCLMAFLLAISGRFTYERSAPVFLGMTLPIGAAEVPADDLPGEQELLWEVVWGFPVKRN